MSTLVAKPDRFSRDEAQIKENYYKDNQIFTISIVLQLTFSTQCGIFIYIYMQHASIRWAPSNRTMSSGVCDQLRFKPACSATEIS